MKMAKCSQISVPVKNLLLEELFIHKETHKNTWVSPDLRTENQIDHIAISRSFRRSLLHVRTKRGADTGSGHHLVVASFRMKITANKNKYNIMRKRLDVKKLENAQLKQEYKMELRNRFGALVGCRCSKRQPRKTE
jgi:hypothetical protein